MLMNCITCTPQQVLFGGSDGTERVMDVRRRGMVGKLNEGVQSEDLSVNGRIIFNLILNKQAGSVCGQTSFGAA